MANRAKFEIKDASYRRCLAFLKALHDVGPRICMQELTAMAYTWEREIKRHMPVDTGLARNSVSVIPAQQVGGTIRAAVGSDVPYVLYLEFGSDYIAGGRVKDWQPGQPPILDWPAKEAGLTGNPGSQRRENAMIPSQTEFMPPFRGSWPLIANAVVSRLRQRLAKAMRDAATKS